MAFILDDNNNTHDLVLSCVLCIEVKWMIWILNNEGYVCLGLQPIYVTMGGKKEFNKFETLNL